MSSIKSITAAPAEQGDLYIQNESGRAHLHDECEHCGPWKDHWEYHSGKSATECCVLDCRNKAEVGAHVKAVECKPAGDLVYIAPMCKAHNASKDMMISKPRQIYIYASQEACKKARS